MDIVSVFPASGESAVFIDKAGKTRKIPLLCWALVRESSDSSYVAGLYLDDSISNRFCVLCVDDDVTFQGYEKPGECLDWMKMLKQEKFFGDS